MVISMRRLVVAAIMLALTSLPVAARAQGETGLPTSFEVVSIRPVPPDSMGLISEPRGTEFRAQAMELSVLVQMTFGINPNQMVIPDWAHSVKFDIAAKTGSSVPLTYEQMKPLMQKMMAERFGMTYHRETREVQGYDMVPAKDGLKLTPAKPGSSKGGGGGPGVIDMPNTTMKSFAGMLTAKLKRPVNDKTGAPADYEVKLRFAPDNDAESSLPSIFTALQEEMGIKLKPAKVPVEMVVIDHLDKAPTDN
jgi:uncharacterized protein (TIGR03435 family)